MIIADQGSSSLGHGQEFRPLEQLDKIYSEHPLYLFFSHVHQHGMDYALDFELTEKERMAELELNLERGNHKSATLKPYELKANI